MIRVLRNIRLVITKFELFSFFSLWASATAWQETLFVIFFLRNRRLAGNFIHESWLFSRNWRYVRLYTHDLFHETEGIQETVFIIRFTKLKVNEKLYSWFVWQEKWRSMDNEFFARFKIWQDQICLVSRNSVLL